jgi:hypothetical protein
MSRIQRTGLVPKRVDFRGDMQPRFLRLQRLRPANSHAGHGTHSMRDYARASSVMPSLVHCHCYPEHVLWAMQPEHVAVSLITSASFPHDVAPCWASHRSNIKTSTGQSVLGLWAASKIQPDRTAILQPYHRPLRSTNQSLTKVDKVGSESLISSTSSIELRSTVTACQQSRI